MMDCLGSDPQVDTWEQCGLGLIVPVFLAVPLFPCASIYWSASHTSGAMSGPQRASLTVTCPVSVPLG